MVAHDRKAKHIDSELPGQKLQPPLDMPLAMIEIPTANRVLPVRLREIAGSGMLS
jgi:hypothetical protein